MLLLILFIVCVAFMVAADIYDVTLTTKGIKAGVAVEANDWLVGQKPSAEALYLRDSLVMGFCIAPCIVVHFLGNDPLAYGALVSPIVCGIQHIRGGLAWKKLM